MRMRMLWMGVMTVGLVACGGADSADSADQADGGDGAAGEAAPPAFVGELEGTDAYVAVVADGDDVEVYACDGESELAVRLLDTVDDPASFVLTNDAGASAAVELVDGVYEGELTLADGSTHAFTTEEAEGDAGLFHAVDAPEGVSAGWVVLNDGRQRGSILFAGGGSLQVRSAPRIDGASGQIGANGPDGALNVQFDRARP
jgi:hypothetical protein